MSHIYKNIIFTNHAYDRIKSRNISEHAVFETINYPDKKQKKSTDSIKYVKTIRNRKHQAIATYKNDQKKYLVISAWVRGEEDKQPIVWQLITLPFRIILWILKKIFTSA